MDVSRRARGIWLGLLLLLILGATAQRVDADPIDAGSLKALFPESSAHFTMDGRNASGWASAQWKFGSDGSLSGYLFTSAYIANRETLGWVR